MSGTGGFSLPSMNFVAEFCSESHTFVGVKNACKCVAFTLLLSAYTTPGSDSTISYVVAANCVHSVGAVAEADRSSRHKFAPEGCQDACYGKVKTWCRETRGEISTYYYLHSRQTESKLCDRLSQVDLLFFSIIHI